MNKVAKVVFWLLILTGIVVLASCTPPQSPIEVKASIDPAPIVGQVVTWRIEINSRKQSVTEVQLYLFVQEGVKLIDGQSEYIVQLDENSKAVIEVPIKVLASGEWQVGAFAGTPVNPKPDESYTSGGDLLVIFAENDQASVVPYDQLPRTPVPAFRWTTGTAFFATATATTGE